MYVILKMKGDYNMDNINMDYINEFRNDNYYLSNFYECPVTYDGLTYRNNEAAFQAQKCINPKDREQFTTLNPSEAKKFGRRVVLRKDWEDIKVKVMTDVVRAKFEQNEDLRKKLLETGNAYLEEGNTWGDRTWGTVNGNGSNLLGKILMQCRDEIAHGKSMKFKDICKPIPTYILCDGIGLDTETAYILDLTTVDNYKAANEYLKETCPKYYVPIPDSYIGEIVIMEYDTNGGSDGNWYSIHGNIDQFFKAARATFENYLKTNMNYNKHKDNTLVKNTRISKNYGEHEL